VTRAQAIRFTAVILIWGLTWRVIADQVGGPVPPIWSVAYRFLAAGAAMFAVVRLTGGSAKMDARGMMFALGVALFQFVANFNLVYEAERHVTSGLAAVVFALMVMLNAVMARIFLGHRLNARIVVGAVLGMGGVLLLFHDDLVRPGGTGGGAALGLGLLLLATLCASSANIMQATARARALPPLTMLAHAMLYGGVLDAAFAWATRGPPVVPVGLRYYAGIAYLAFVGSAAAFAIYYKLIRDIGPSRAANINLATPFVAMGVSTLFEGYRWTPWALGGAVLAAAGIALALVKPRARVDAIPPASGAGAAA